MGRIYINLHTNYDYATAVIQNYVDLRQYVRERDYMIWAREQGIPQIMIFRQDKGEQHITDFINDMKALQCEVYTRNTRGEEWNRA